MLRESGRVVAVEDGAVWVETVRSSLCGKCAARAGCGHGVLARAGGSRGLIRAIETPDVAAVQCAVDDEVDIDLPESVVLHASLLVYLMPLLAAMAGALAAESWGEAATVMGFVTGLSLGFWGVRYLPTWIGRPEQFEPRLAAVRKHDHHLIVSG